MKAKSYLLIDIGNSCLKWGIGQGDDISTESPLLHQAKDWQQGLLVDWWLIERPTKVAIACVGHQDLLVTVSQLIQKLWSGIEIITAKSQAQFAGVINVYSQPEKLGVDRWLTLLAVNQEYQQAVCIVDCGTAITVDMLDAQGKHLGGVISSGLRLMKQSLQQNTQQLKLSKQTYSLGLANFTEAAIDSGTLYAAVGLIEQVILKQEIKPLLLLTGGDADIIAPHLSSPVKIKADLVLRGLLVMIEHQ